MDNYISLLLIRGILLLVLFPNTLYSQEWAPVGARWYYSTSGTAGGGGLLTIESVKDTVIESLECKKFKFSDIKEYATGPDSYYWGTTTTYEFFYYNADSVSHYDKSNGYFYKLYDFNAEAGDTVLVRNEEFPGELPYTNFEYIVDSVVLKNIDGFQLRHLYVHGTEAADWLFTSPFQPVHAIIENIGSTIRFLGISYEVLSLDWGSQYFLRCYIDDNINYHFELYSSELECDYLPTNLEDNVLGQISIYPNPVTDYLTIDTEYNIRQLINISDSQGKLIYAQEVTGQAIIDMNNWYPGVYFLQLNINYRIVLNKLIIKL